MESPWSTPTQSEIGEAEAALHNPKGGFFLDPPGDRELGDGEPSFDANVDDYMAMAANNNIEQDFADDLSQRSSSRGATTRGSKSKRSNSKSPEKRASRSPNKKGGRKGKKSNSKLDPGQGRVHSFWKVFHKEILDEKICNFFTYPTVLLFWPISQSFFFYWPDLQLSHEGQGLELGLGEYPDIFITR